VQLFGRTRKAAVAGHRQKYAQLVQGGVAQVHTDGSNAFIKI
jgi:hypothetical protein